MIGITFVDDLPTGCIEATSPFIESVSSVSVAAGVSCTLWEYVELMSPGTQVENNTNNKYREYSRVYIRE
jgi:hypothetical protein